MLLGNLQILETQDTQYPEVGVLLDRVFGSQAEKNLLHNLRDKPDFIEQLSLVAVLDEKIIGYILFFPVKIKMDTGEYEKALALAPMAVDSLYQRLGIGTKLIETGHSRASELGFGVSVVLGHAEYYPKFGYLRASGFKIRSSFEVPEEAYMVYEIVQGELSNVSGTVEYPPEFQET